MKVIKVALAVAGLASLMIAGSTALAASAPAGGPIRVFVASPTAVRSKIVITGAIGDYGTTVSVNKNGKVNPNGNYEKVTLSKGSFWVNATAFNTKISKLTPKVNPATCSADLVASGPVALFKGSGLYTGIGGTVKITITFAALAPRFTSGAKTGQCNLPGKQLAGYQSLTGVGNATFG